VLLLAGILVALPVGLLQIPSVQRSATAFAEKQLSALLHTKVTVESLEATWLSRLALRNLTIDDLNGKPLMQVSNLTVGFKLLPAFKGKVELTTVRMFGFTLRINRPTPSEETNMQFIIKALSGGEAESDLSVKAKSLILSRGTVSYDVENKAVTSGVFNTSHLNFSEISGKLALHHYSADSLFAEVKALSFVEASGLKVKKLSAALSGHPDTLDVNDLVIKFPASEIAFPSAVISNSSGKVHLQTGIASVREARITPADFAAFLPALKHFSEKATLSFTLDGSVDSLSVENMSLVYNGGLLALRGNALVEGLAAKGRKLYVAGRSIEACITAEGLQQCMAAFNSQPLPETLRQLGNVALKSEVAGYIDALAVSGEATTDLGALRFNLNALNHYNRDTLLLVKGNVVTDGFNLAKLFADGNNFGSLVCDATLNIMRTPTCPFHLATDANISQIGFNGYDYSGVHLTGSMHGGEYEGIAAIDDPNVKLRAKGAYQTGKITLDAKVEALRPDKLHFTDRYENPTLAFDAGIDIAGNTLDDFIGNIDVNNLTFSTQNDSFAVNNISISSVQDEEAQKTISIESEVADAVIKGQLSLSTLMPELFDVLDDYLPALVSTLKINAVKQSTNYNDFRCMATIVSVNDITRTLKLPFTVDNQAEIKGGFNSRERKVSLEASLPAFAFQGNRFENSLIVIENNNDVATLLVDMTHLNKNALRNKLNIKAVAVNDRIDTRLRWSNDKEERYETTLNTSTVFAAEQSEQSRPALRTEITIPETKVTLKDSVWTVQPSSLTIANGALHIDNFNFTRGERLLRLDGVISDNPRDMLTLEMKDIETAYIFEVVNIPALRFGGAATGTVTGRDLKGSMMLDGKMEVRDFAFNNAPQGLLRMTCEWDNDRQGILMLGTIYKNDSVFTDVNGYIFPVGDNQGLSLWFDANEINIAFLQRYMQAFATNVGGEGFGSVHLFGSFSDIFVEGKPYVKNAKMKINVLNTDYTFSDTVFLERYNITARNTRFYDRDGNEGYINFLLNHHNFRDLRYSLDVNTGKSLVYDIPESVNPKMYGKVYAGGTATVSGDENEITVEGNVSSKAGTSMGFNFVGQTIAADYDFISFTKPLSDTLSVRTAQSANSAAAVAAAARRRSPACPIFFSQNIP